jgi:hypothetical protein
VLAILLAHAMAAAATEGAEPQPSQRAPRTARPRRDRLPQHGSLAGRRPRG